MSSIGILSQGSKVYAENMLVANCGQHLLALNIGGFYDFKHCTFANFWSFSSRQTPSIFLNNYYEDVNGNVQYRDLIQANFGNCIIDGSNETELLFDKSEKATFNYIIDHCVLKLNSDYWDNWSHELCDGVILCETAGFIDNEINDFQLDSNSVSLNVGSQLIAQEVPFDINNVSRIKSPDVGCFERVE